jgi:nucleoid-associated protein YgaU
MISLQLMNEENIMKTRILTLFVIILVVVTVSSAQEKLSKEEWQNQISQYTSQRDNLKSRLASLTKDIDGLRSTLASLDKQIQAVRDETLAMTGASEAMRKDFEDRLKALESRVAALLNLSNQDLYVRRFEVDSVQAIKDNLRKERIAAAERYYERLQKIQSNIDNLRATLASVKTVAAMEEHYVVRSWSKYRDCLWNISKKKKIYDNPFMWPKIWQANRDQIKDPDIIRIGEHLKIPPEGGLTTAEKRAEQKYWSQKHS